MPHDDTPKTRTELKRSGKEKQGPYSAKHARAYEARRLQAARVASGEHIRLAAALAERRPAPPPPAPPPKKK